MTSSRHHKRWPWWSYYCRAGGTTQKRPHGKKWLELQRKWQNMWDHMRLYPGRPCANATGTLFQQTLLLSTGNGRYLPSVRPCLPRNRWPTTPKCTSVLGTISCAIQIAGYACKYGDHVAWEFWSSRRVTGISANAIYVLPLRGHILIQCQRNLWMVII